MYVAFRARLAAADDADTELSLHRQCRWAWQGTAAASVLTIGRNLGVGPFVRVWFFRRLIQLPNEKKKPCEACESVHESV